MILACARQFHWAPDVTRRQRLRDLNTIIPLLLPKED